jgi:hypothetical protein
MLPFEMAEKNEEITKLFLAPILPSPKGTTVFSVEKLGQSYEKALPSSLDKAADFLSRVLLAERLFKRLVLDDPKHVVALIYCVLRLAPESVTSQRPIELIKTQYGKYWQWPLVWIVSQQFEIVKQRAEEEEARGKAFLIDWRKQCQKYANNLWIEEKKKAGNIAKQKKMMVESLRTHPVIKRFTNEA